MTITTAVLCPATQLTGSAATIITGATNQKTVITRARFTNSSASTAYTFTVYRVASGGSAGTTNILINARSIAAGGSDLAPELTNMVLAAGDTIQALASTTAEINAFASGFYSTT
jgi:hypothetical protein